MIVGSIDVTQSEEKKQTSQSIQALKPVYRVKKTVDRSKNFLKELGLNSEQFKILVDNLPQPIAVYRVVYDHKGKPVDYLLLESNKAYDSLHFFKRDRIGKRATLFNFELKKDFARWTEIFGDVDRKSVV